MWKIVQGKVTWLSPWRDSSLRLTRPLLGSGRQRGPAHPSALQGPACPLCKGWTDPESCPSPLPSNIPLSHTSIPITPSTSCLLGPPPQVRMNAIWFFCTDSNYQSDSQPNHRPLPTYQIPARLQPDGASETSHQLLSFPVCRLCQSLLKNISTIRAVKVCWIVQVITKYCRWASNWNKNQPKVS